jgi:UDP-N-acetylglucosamine transferase subunit ALG13
MDFLEIFKQVLIQVYGQKAETELDPDFQDHLLIFFHSGIGVVMDHLSGKSSEIYTQLFNSWQTSVNDHQERIQLSKPKPTNINEAEEVSN